MLFLTDFHVIDLKIQAFDWKFLSLRPSCKLIDVVWKLRDFIESYTFKSNVYCLRICLNQSFPEIVAVSVGCVKIYDGQPIDFLNLFRVRFKPLTYPINRMFM